MKIIIRQPIQNTDLTYKLQDIQLENVAVANYALLAIDGSTTNTGLAIIRQSDGAIMYTASASKEKDEEPVRYKLRLKNYVKDLLLRNRFIDQIYYEEPTISHLSAVKNLFMLRSFIEEMIIENEPTFDYLKHYEVNNMRWKKEFLHPEKVPFGTDNQKKAVRDKLEKSLPFLSVVTQDEIDAIGLGYAAAKHLMNGNDNGGEELVSKKKTRPFQYNSLFIGADCDDDAFVEFYDVYNGPEKILENGISFSEIDTRVNFDKHICNTMGDDDKVLIIKFNSNHHGDVILKYRIGYLSTQYEYIYAIIWRKSRKV